MTSSTKHFLLLFIFCTGFFFPFVASSGSDNELDSLRYSIDVFRKLLTALNITHGLYIPKDRLVHILDKITSRYVCETKPTCSNALCLSADEVVEISAGRLIPKLSREEFDKFALVVLYRLQKKDELCKPPPPLSFSEYEEKTVDLLTDDEHISVMKLDEVLHRLTGTSHPHDHDHDHDDHDRRRRSARTDGKVQRRKVRRDSRSNSHESDEHNHDHSGHDDHSGQDDHSGHDDDDDDHEDDIKLPALYKTDCFNSELVVDQAKSETRKNISSEIKSIASVIIYHLYKGTNFDDSCRILPTRKSFIKNLFQSLPSVNGTLTLEGFKKIIKKLGIGLLSSNAGHDTDGHGHNHKKRSLNKRIKRLVGKPMESTEKIDKCFTDLELLSVFSNQPTPTIKSEVFTNLCPALVQQYVSGVCKIRPKVIQKISPAESYGYGTICVVIICLCSVVGALVVVCKNRSAFMYTMALFEGLAVGTLTSDAVLHLIPQALGLHQHGDEEHGNEENGGPGYLWFCLACLGGLYVFYLLEVVLAWFNEGHGHSHDFTESQVKNPEIYTVSENSKSVEEKVGSQMNIVEGKTEIKRTYRIPPLALMIVIGDALHNFADGLAIGAAFNESIVIGFATSVAVLCHELPHELGDFGVLLGSGIGFKRAIFFNLFSSLTALIGLYIGLVIATDIVIRQWIFAVTSGMFLYISLVDLLPILKSNDLKSNKGLLLFSNVGILVGVVIMLLIGMYEEEIKFTN